MAFGDERSINLANFTIPIRQISSQQNVGEIDLWSFNYMKNYLIQSIHVYSLNVLLFGANTH